MTFLLQLMLMWKSMFHLTVNIFVIYNNYTCIYINYKIRQETFKYIRIHCVHTIYARTYVQTNFNQLIVHEFQETSTYFCEALQKWSELNCTEHFSKFFI